MCAAYAQLQRSKDVSFSPGIVDIDGTRVIGKRKMEDKRVWTAEAKRAACAQKCPAARQPFKRPAKGTAVHPGRLFLMKHRQTNEQAACPLQRRVTKKGTWTARDDCGGAAGDAGEAVEPAAHRWF